MTGLINWAWQGMALAIGLALVLRCSRAVNAATRYALWWLALGAVLALPLVGPVTLWVAGVAGGCLTDPATATIAVPLGATAATAAGSLISVPAAPDWLVACAIGLWFGSVLVGSGRLIAAVRTVVRLKTESQPVAPAIGRTLRLWTLTTTTSRRPADLRTSRTIAGACALGLTGRPTIVVSRTLASTLDAATLDLIVLHEQLHLSRYDDWSRLAQSVLVTLFGLHPAVRFISAQLDREREAACDEAVAVRTGDARRYATCLADVADVITGRQALIAPLAVPNAGGSGLLFTRVQRLLDPGITRRSQVRGLVLAAASVLLAAGSLTVTAAGTRVLTEAVISEPLAPLAAVRATRLVEPAGNLPLGTLASLGALGTLGTLETTTPVAGGVMTRADAARPLARTSRQLISQPTVTVVPAALTGAPLPEEGDPTLKAELETEKALLPSVELRFLADVQLGAKQNVTADLRSGDNSWAVIGASARRAGLALGSSVGRAGKAVASRF